MRLLGRILLWILTAAGAAGMVGGALIANYANSPENRSGTPLADIGVAMGIGIAILGSLVFLGGVVGLYAARKRQ